MQLDGNCISYWLPKLEAAGLPVPQTKIIKVEGDRNPVSLLDGKLPEDYHALCLAITDVAADFGWPLFLRTGHGSAKHQWAETCCLNRDDEVGNHILALVEWSHMVTPMGFPTDVWAVRKMLRTDPLFRVATWDEFPVTREFRYFVFDGQVTHRQPYWPPAAIEEALLTGQPTPDAWEEKLERASELLEPDLSTCNELARQASRAVPGYWSVDLLQDHYGSWWITDMAWGEESFRWDPATGEGAEPRERDLGKYDV